MLLLFRTIGFWGIMYFFYTPSGHKLKKGKLLIFSNYNLTDPPTALHDAEGSTITRKE